MKLIFRERDIQKARQLFEEAEGLMANGEKVIIITPNSRALRVKAENYGFNLTIIEPNELTQELAQTANGSARKAKLQQWRLVYRVFILNWFVC